MFFVQIYVDIISGATNFSLYEEFAAKRMHSEFEISMIREINFFLGFQIKELKEGTSINQGKYIKDLLERFNLEEVKTMKTPMSLPIKFDKDEKGKSIDQTMYRGMIGSLLYLTTSRLDIMYSVCLCARFQSCPKESHLSAVKRILKYLQRTMVWTRIFHVCTYSMARLIFIKEKLNLEKFELPFILFYFILKGKIKQERKP